jgi:rod shape-determining protein MreB
MANSFIGRDMAVDLGTANTLVYVRGKGVLLDEPSVVALNATTGEILAVGHEAKRMIGRTPDNITAIRPLKDGVIADFEATEQMLRSSSSRCTAGATSPSPRMVDLRPERITAVEQRAVKEAGYQAGARASTSSRSRWPPRSAPGCPCTRPPEHGRRRRRRHHRGRRHLLGGIVTSLSIRTAGDDLDQAIVAWMKKEYSLMLGERTAEEVKMTLGSAFPLPDEPEAEIRGRDMVSGLPATVVVSSSEVRQALEEPLHASSTRPRHPRPDPARAGRRHHGPRHRAHRRGRAAARPRRAAAPRDRHARPRRREPARRVALGAGKCVEEFEALQQVLVSEPGGSDGVPRTRAPRRERAGGRDLDGAPASPRASAGRAGAGLRSR